MNEMTAGAVLSALRQLSDPQRARSSAWFFKTGPGQYGQGDQFIGVTVPQQRAVAKRFRTLPLPEVERLLASPVHEDRLTALFILVWQYQHADTTNQTRIVRLYYRHRDRVNNWDLVDSSAHLILGHHSLTHSRGVLYRLAKSKSLWDRRIAIVSTFAFIRAGQADDAFAIADLLMNDREDLIHKAVGWTLREVGKYLGPEVLEGYLKTRYQSMPRTMLRYAIEHFDAPKRRRYLQGLI